MAEEKPKADNKALIATVIGTVGALALAVARVAPLLLVADYVTFPATTFFQPGKVKGIADGFRAASDCEDDFILNAWNWVGRSIAYEPVGSDIDFNGDLVSCQYCYTVDETLRRGRGNCVAKSALLGSILLNYIEPRRVNMAIGVYSDGREQGGHAWLQVTRGGAAYVVEATSPPRLQPWRTTAALAKIYIPYTLFSVEDFRCLNDHICLQAGCDCRPDVW